MLSKLRITRAEPFTIRFLEEIRAYKDTILDSAHVLEVTMGDITRANKDLERFILKSGIDLSLLPIIKIINKLNSNTDMRVGKLYIPNTAVMSVSPYIENLKIKSDVKELQ